MQTLGFQDARDRRSSDLMPEILESTLDAPVSFLVCVHLRGTSRRCHRRSVSGVTIRRELAQRVSTQSVRSPGQSSPVIICEPQTPLTDLPPENAIFFDQ